jgi:hypothetical protein
VSDTRMFSINRELPDMSDWAEMFDIFLSKIIFKLIHFLCVFFHIPTVTNRDLVRI